MRRGGVARGCAQGSMIVFYVVKIRMTGKFLSRGNCRCGFGRLGELWAQSLARLRVFGKCRGLALNALQHMLERQA